MKKTNHNLKKIITDENSKLKIVKNKVNREFGKNVLKNLNPSFIKIMINEFIQTICKINNFKYSNFTNSELNTVIIDNDNTDNVLSILDKSFFEFMNNYIEEKMKEPSKNFNRSITMYETKIENKKKVLITW